MDAASCAMTKTTSLPSTSTYGAAGARVCTTTDVGLRRVKPVTAAERTRPPGRVSAIDSSLEKKDTSSEDAEKPRVVTSAGVVTMRTVAPVALDVSSAPTTLVSTSDCGWG